MKPLPTVEELERVATLVKAVLPRHRQPRWLTVLRGDPAKWSRLDMDDLFRIADRTPTVRSIGLADELRKPDLARNPPATMFRLSASPHLLRGALQDVVDAVVEDDALIITHGLAVALASHHSDGWVVCRTSQ